MSLQIKQSWKKMIQRKMSLIWILQNRAQSPKSLDQYSMLKFDLFDPMIYYDMWPIWPLPLQCGDPAAVDRQHRQAALHLYRRHCLSLGGQQYVLHYIHYTRQCLPLGGQQYLLHYIHYTRHGLPLGGQQYLSTKEHIPLSTSELQNTSQCLPLHYWTLQSMHYTTIH